MIVFHRRPAFSLVELLVVVAIIAMIMAFVVPVTGDVMQASRMTDATNQVEGFFINARQTAIAHNHTVEVRFYQFGDPEVPGEQAANPASGRFRAMQFFEYLDQGEAMPVTKVERLPDGIVFDSGATLSTLLGPSQKKTFTGSNLDPQVNLPRGVNTNYNCCAFQIMPSGTTKLAIGSWYVTLHKLSDGDALPAPKGNYATIQIDGVSGEVTPYRP